MLDIINGILDLARIEAEKFQIKEEFVTLDTLIQTALTTIRPISQRKSIDINCALENYCIGVVRDSIKLTQAILNLLSNSAKFTEQGGHIQIATTFHKNGDLMLSISDTGVGIPAGLIQKILRPFEQVEDHLTREQEGTGLGLPIARAIIELHGGELVLSSEVGVGTTARVRLPAVRVRHALDNGDGPQMR